MDNNDTPLYKGRRRLLAEELANYGSFNKNILLAIKNVPRHLFVEKGLEEFAYNNTPVAIGANQTISQPSTVALQTQLLELRSGDKILEIGTGCGYQTAILFYLGGKVFSIERHESLFKVAQENLKNAGYYLEEELSSELNNPYSDEEHIARINNNITLIWGDGFEGFEQEAPFDKIIVTCGAPNIPTPLLRQLKIGGKMVIPVDIEERNNSKEKKQTLLSITRVSKDNYERESFGIVDFVPMLKGKIL